MRRSKIRVVTPCGRILTNKQESFEKSPDPKEPPPSLRKTEEKYKINPFTPWHHDTINSGGGIPPDPISPAPRKSGARKEVHRQVDDNNDCKDNQDD